MTDIEAIRARLGALGSFRDDDWFVFDNFGTYSIRLDDGGPGYVEIASTDQPESVAEFFAHAPEDIATLIDEIFNLRNQWASALDEADEEIKRLTEHVRELQEQDERNLAEITALADQRDAAIQKLQMYLFAISEGAFTMTEDWLVSDFKGLLHILGAPE